MKEILIIGSNASLSRQMMDVLNKTGHSAGWIKSVPDPSILPDHTNHFLTVINAEDVPGARHGFLQALADRGLPVLFIVTRETRQHELLRGYHGYAEILEFPFGKKAFVSKVNETLNCSRHSLIRGALTLNALTGRAMLNGQDLRLTGQEFSLLKVLMQADKGPVSRDELLKKAWGYECTGGTRTVDVHVQRLRRKIGMDMIRTVYRKGYCLAPA